MSEKEVRLTEEEQIYLKSILKNGVHNSHILMRARVLLLLDRTGKADHVRYTRTANDTGLSRQAIYNMRDEYLANHDVETYLTRKKRETPPVAPKLDGKAEAEIVALACSEPPKGFSRWTLRLLATKAVELHYVDNISHMLISQLLKKRNISLI